MTRKAATVDRRSSPITTDRLPTSWREHARARHLDLIARLVGVPAGRWLKTDLYEELQENRALIPHLPSAAWIGMDVSGEVAEGSIERSWAAAVVDVRSLAFADAAFDGILSTSTLDHFTDRRDLHSSLAELRRVLRPGGRLILTLDNLDNPLIRMRNRLPEGLAALTGLVPYPAGVTLGRQDAEGALRAAGFAVDHFEYLLHVPHIVGTRLTRFKWFRRHAIGRFEQLGRTGFGRFSGHYLAFVCTCEG